MAVRTHILSALAFFLAMAILRLLTDNHGGGSIRMFEYLDLRVHLPEALRAIWSGPIHHVVEAAVFLILLRGSDAFVPPIIQVPFVLLLLVDVCVGISSSGHDEKAFSNTDELSILDVNAGSNQQLSWSVLPDIILLGLVNYLPTLDDIVRFGHVCHNWRIFLRDFLRFLPFSDPPLLLSLSDDPILLKRITASGLYRTQIPCGAKLGNRWLGSSFGYMIFTSWNRSRTECRITISDPIKGSNIVSPRLPNVKLPYHHAFLTSPICSPECIIILFFYGFKTFYFSRIGVNESCWNTQSLRVPCQVVQTFYSKTHRKIFAIDDSKEVNILEISITGEPFYQKLLTTSFKPVGICEDLVFDRQHFNPTVVECGKEMLLILFMQKHRGGQISKIEIYKLNFLEATKEKKETRSWTKFNEVLDYAIFIDWGGRNPVALHHPQRWGGKVNSVYLAGPGCTSWMVLPIGVDFKDPTYSQHNSAISADSLNSSEKWPSSIWIYPTMCFQEQ